MNLHSALIHSGLLHWCLSIQKTLEKQSERWIWPRTRKWDVSVWFWNKGIEQLTVTDDCNIPIRCLFMKCCPVISCVSDPCFPSPHTLLNHKHQTVQETENQVMSWACKSIGVWFSVADDHDNDILLLDCVLAVSIFLWSTANVCTCQDLGIRVTDLFPLERGLGLVEHVVLEEFSTWLRSSVSCNGWVFPFWAPTLNNVHISFTDLAVAVRYINWFPFSCFVLAVYRKGVSLLTINMLLI